MKFILAAVTLSAVFALSPGLGEARTAVAAYSVSGLPGLAGLANFSPVGVDRWSDVAGTTGINGKNRIAVLIRRKSGSHLVSLPLPRGVGSIVAAGINDDGQVAATGFRSVAGHQDGGGIPLVALFDGKGYTWVRLPEHVGYRYRIVGIADNGAVAATRIRVKGHLQRAVVWLPAAGKHKYAGADVLRLSWRSTASQSTAIWSAPTGPAIVIGQVDYLSEVAVWTLGAGGPATLAVAKSNGTPSAIGGWGTHVYMTGRTHGVDTGGGWSSRIRIATTHRATVGPIRGLTIKGFIGVECFYGADSVTAGAHGELLAVGSIGCVSRSGERPLIWRGSRVDDLNNLISRGVGWHLSQTYDIDTQGQILASGTLHGRPEFALLRPIV